MANAVGTGSFAYTIVWLRAPKLSVSGPRVHHVDEFNALRLVCSVDAAAWPPVDSVEWRKYSSPDSLSEYQVLSKEWTLDLKWLRHGESDGAYACLATQASNDSLGVVRRALQSSL